MEKEQIEIQKAVFADCDSLHKMQVKVFTPLLEKYEDYEISPATETFERFAGKFSQTFTDYWNVLLNGRRIGGIRIYNFGELCKLSNFFILQEYQNRGYGQRVMRLVETEYPGAKQWQLTTILQEERLCHLYEKMGYIRTGEIQPVKNGMDLVSYRKET